MLFFLTLYSSDNPENVRRFHQNIEQHNHIRMISEELKTGVMIPDHRNKLKKINSLTINLKYTSRY